MGATFAFVNDKRPSGLASVGWQKGANIRLSGAVCGRISPLSLWEIRRKGENYAARLTVYMETGNPNRNWGWTTLAVRTDTLEEMKAWLKEYTGKIAADYKLRFAEKQQNGG